MAEIVADHAALLKKAGFRKRRHCFNRSAHDGLVHVVYFWQAPKEPPAWTEVPGLRERLYGSFRLDFGVYIPEMTRSRTPRGSWINDYDCHLRRTIGQLMGQSNSGLWWRLDSPDISAVAGRALIDYGLPWLNSFPDREAVIATFDEIGPLALGMSPAGPLDMADLLRATGRTADERRILESYVDEPVLPSHARYLATHLRDRGHEDLVPRIATKQPAQTAD
jgi:Domain of unknown function (DUF4304)